MNIDLMYIVSCNAATYFVIKMIEGARRKPIKLRTWWKRLISLIVAIGMGCMMYYGFNHEMEPLFYGAFIQFLTWDYLFKPIMKALPGFFTPLGGQITGEPIED